MLPMKIRADTNFPNAKRLQDDSYSLGGTLQNYTVEEISVRQAKILLHNNAGGFPRHSHPTVSPQ
jgi:hypothetical protein